MEKRVKKEVSKNAILIEVREQVHGPSTSQLVPSSRMRGNITSLTTQGTPMLVENASVARCSFSAAMPSTPAVRGVRF